MLGLVGRGSRGRVGVVEVCRLWVVLACWAVVGFVELFYLGVQLCKVGVVGLFCLLIYIALVKDELIKYKSFHLFIFYVKVSFIYN